MKYDKDLTVYQSNIIFQTITVNKVVVCMMCIILTIAVAVFPLSYTTAMNLLQIIYLQLNTLLTYVLHNVMRNCLRKIKIQHVWIIDGG